LCPWRLWEKTLSKLILTKIETNEFAGRAAALQEDGRIVELRLAPLVDNSILGNMYIGKVENIAANIGAAFVQIAPGQRCYLPLKEAERAVFAPERKEGSPLRSGDELLVQVSRAAMKGKLPSVTTNLNFTGKYLVLTSGDKTVGFSSKLNVEDKKRLTTWLSSDLEDENRGYGLIVRTNAAEAEKEELLREFTFLKEEFFRVMRDGQTRICYSILYRTPKMCLEAVRDVYSRGLEEIVTDDLTLYEDVREWLLRISPGETDKLCLYQDKLLPLYKLYRLETALGEVMQERVWLKSGGFLVIQQTEAFVSIDVNSGKYTGKKKAEETYRKINLEAAGEISRQLRLRNLSGIILIDFINMENPDHTDELFHVLQKYLRHDPVKARAIDITPLHILEMTRKKVRRPVREELLEIKKKLT
jgi:ribonuclease G